MGRYSGMTGDDAYAILHNKTSGGGGTGTTDYNALTNKPKLNGIELSGEKLASAFGLPIIYYNNNETENTPLIVSELEPGIYVSYYGALILKGYADSEEVLERRAINGVLFVYRKFQEGMTQWDTVASFLDDGLNLNQISVTTQYPYGLSITNIAYIGSVTRGDSQETVEALWTFQKLPQSEVTPSDNKDFTTKSYVDSMIVNQVDHGTSDTTFSLPPNQYHIWGEVTSLTLTLDTETSGRFNGYWFSFDSGDTATTLSLPETVKTDIVVEPNMHYECSIVGNYMTFSDWEVSA